MTPAPRLRYPGGVAEPVDGELADIDRDQRRDLAAQAAGESFEDRLRALDELDRLARALEDPRSAALADAARHRRKDLEAEALDALVARTCPAGR